METVYDLLVVLHLVGWAIVLGGCLVTLREPALPKGAWHGILTALVTGLALAALALSGTAGHEPPVAKLVVKLVLTLVVAGLIAYGRRRPEAVTRGLVGAVTGVTVATVAVAVLW